MHTHARTRTHARAHIHTHTQVFSIFSRRRRVAAKVLRRLDKLENTWRVARLDKKLGHLDDYLNRIEELAGPAPEDPSPAAQIYRGWVVGWVGGWVGLHLSRTSLTHKTQSQTHA